jgi:hypothetical protein
MTDWVPAYWYRCPYRCLISSHCVTMARMLMANLERMK